MQIPEFGKLNLVGGTSLALQIGHRKSINIDLFGYVDIDEFELTNILNHFKSFQILNQTTNIKTYLINNIKVDIVNYPYKWLDPFITHDEIRLATMKDIAAMKLSAITGRGTKKDFIDIYFLLDYFTLKDMMGFYHKKFPDGSDFMVLKSLAYFKDAEKNKLPIMLKRVFWGDIKKRIIAETKAFLTR
jgi:hypothetical protein